MPLAMSNMIARLNFLMAGRRSFMLSRNAVIGCLMCGLL
jgi:hypothetical protein